MKAELLEYLKNKFPDLTHQIHVRFELGEPFENGTDERLNQVYFRVNTIFKSLFKEEDSIYLLIKDWQEDDSMYGNTTPNYLYELLDNTTIESEFATELMEDEDPAEILIITEINSTFAERKLS